VVILKNLKKSSLIKSQKHKIVFKSSVVKPIRHSPQMGDMENGTFFNHLIFTLFIQKDIHFPLGFVELF